MEWHTVEVGSFLKPRTERFKPNNKAIIRLKRVDKIDFNGNIYISDKPSKTDMILVKRGDLIISGINVEKGAMSIYQDKEDLTATIHYSSYEYDEEKIDIDFLKYYLRSPKLIQAIKDQVPGGIKTEIKAKHILPLKVCIPKTTKQQRELVSRIILKESIIKNSLSEIDNQLSLHKNLRQQILQDAVQGKLVPRDPADEPASVLLEKIKEEKEQLIKEGKIKRGKPLPPIKEEEIPFKIPENWVWCRLGEIGIINPRNYLADNIEVAFIPMALISEKYGLTPEFETRKWGEIKNGFTHFAENDVAIAKITPCFENSKAAVFHNLRNGYGAGTTELHVIRTNSELVNPNYIYILFKTTNFLINGARIMRGVAGQKRVPVDYVKEYLISLPPINEQNRIVDKVSGLMKYCDEFEQTIEQNQKYTQELLQVVLMEALEPEKV